MSDYGQLSDEQLLTACRSGDEAAWNALVGRYERLVYTVPVRYGLTSGEVDDVFQTVWLSLLKNLDKIREPDRIGAWLVTTARRECWERRRGSDYTRNISIDMTSSLFNKEGQELNPEDVVAHYREYQSLREALDQLGKRCRELLDLLYFDASVPSYSEVSDLLHMPIGSIGPMRARCLKRLRVFLVGLTDDE